MYIILYYIIMCSTRGVRIFVAHYVCSFYHYYYYYYFVVPLINEGFVLACRVGETKQQQKIIRGGLRGNTKKIF